MVSRHGWSPTSDPMVVTKAIRKTVYELNGLPVLNVYMEHIA
ncbi:TPA: hypothetical protein DDZ49_04725 [Candidatus Wolfebacteria bacterium]|nr:hypothetical protein [Candidatus Wolfebacteria bacterium]HAS95429.1 hypothetical protein [Candidatus Wolfebacteria bacterium]HBD17864.1 hypothetical protein [Candidatus Wolfebacteria bacterium]HBN87434.1 hypothetical protein [Candidatus Wolfebacteria bacterium]HBT74529.1 hypothetical protein [Candidatus Wolfebacteria bacterium]